jgi:hypothetical protein
MGIYRVHFITLLTFVTSFRQHARKAGNGLLCMGFGPSTCPHLVISTVPHCHPPTCLYFVYPNGGLMNMWRCPHARRPSPLNNNSPARPRVQFSIDGVLHLRDTRHSRSVHRATQLRPHTQTRPHQDTETRQHVDTRTRRHSKTTTCGHVARTVMATRPPALTSTRNLVYTSTHGHVYAWSRHLVRTSTCSHIEFTPRQHVYIWTRIRVHV